MRAKDYANFSTEDFLTDDDFIRYVKYKSAADVQFWANWAVTDAFKAAEIQLGVILSAKPLPLPTDFADSLWNSIEAGVEKYEKRTKTVKLRRIWLSTAAACMAITLFGSWYFNSSITVSTPFGQQMVIDLPDGSQVRLNANSSITYPRALTWKPERHVFIDGEAYFDVKHINRDTTNIQSGEKFIVTSKKLEVEVLGTTFNLKSRQNIDQVTLVTGKVSVRSLLSGDLKILKPGERANLDANYRISLSPKSPLGPQVSWTAQKLLLTQTRIGDIISEFENLYGYRIILPDATMANRRIDGTISTENKESMLFVLKNILNVNARQEGQNIYLEKR